MRILVILVFLHFSFFSTSQSFDNLQKSVDSLTAIKQNDKIIPFLQRVIELYPKDDLALRFLGSIYMDSNKFDLAEKCLRKAIVLNSSCAICYANLSRLYFAKEDDKSALEFINTAINIEPEKAYFYSLRSEFKDVIGDMSGSSSDINKAIELESDNGELYTQRAQLNTRKGANFLALKDFNRAIEIEPYNAEYYFKRSGYYFDQIMLEESLLDINNAIRLDSTVPLFYVGKGAIFARYENFKDAVLYYSKAIQLDSTNYFFYYNRSLGRYSLEDMDGSCEDLNRSYKLLLTNDSTNELINELKVKIADFCDSKKASYYYQRGIAFFNLNRYEEAIEIYSEGLKKFPNNSMLLSFRGNSKLTIGQYSEAILDYHKSIQNQANLIDEIIGNRNSIKLDGKTVENTEYVEKLVRGMKFSLAQCKFALKEYDSSLIEINKIIDSVSSSIELASYLNLRGNIYISMDKYIEAISDFDKCLQINPSFSIAYVNRAFAKLNVDADLKSEKMGVTLGVNKQDFTTMWSIPVKVKIRKNDLNVLSALEDCNHAIKLDPSFDYAYYIRANVNRVLGSSIFCDDFIIANKNGYPVELYFLEECGIIKK